MKCLRDERRSMKIEIITTENVEKITFSFHGTVPRNLQFVRKEYCDLERGRGVEKNQAPVSP